MLKSDVEGFESEVFDGAVELLNQDSLKVLIVEMKDHGARYGFDEAALFRRILDLGFTRLLLRPLYTYTDDAGVFL